MNHSRQKASRLGRRSAAIKDRGQEGVSGAHPWWRRGWRASLAAGLALAALAGWAGGPPHGGGVRAESQGDDADASLDRSWQGQVVLLHLRDADLADGRAFANVRAVLDKAGEDGAAGLVWKLDLSSLSVERAMDYAQTLAQVEIPTIAWVAPTGLGGGALVTLAADRIWMAPGALVGAAAPEYPSSADLSEAGQEQLYRQRLALTKARVRSLAAGNGHPQEVALAFVDSSDTLERGGRVLVERGDILILDADQAMLPGEDGRPLLAAGIAAEVDDLLQQAGWDDQAGVVELRADEFTRILQDQRRRDRAAMAAERTGRTEVPEREADDPEAGEDATARTDAEADEDDNDRPFWQTREDSFAGQVVVIKVGMTDLISPARFRFMQRMLERASREGAEAVIFDIDTPGGLVWDTTTLIMEDLQKVTVPTFAYVNPRALSAGAMVSIGTDGIYMSRAGTIGAATPVYSGGMAMGEDERAKMNSAVMGMARAAARANGYRWEVIEAMIEKDRELIIDGQVLCAAGEILTLDATEATMLFDGQPLLAKAIVADLEELAAMEGLQGELVEAEPLAMEYFAQMVATYAAVLILVGVVGAYMELQSPGFGVPGFVAVAAFAVFFFGHYVAGSLVTYEALVVFVLGASLIILELLFFPGMLVGAVPGFLMMCGALLYVMAGTDLRIPEGQSIPTNLAAFAVPLRNLILGLLGGALLLAVLARWLPETKLFRRVILGTTIGGQPELATPEGLTFDDMDAADGSAPATTGVGSSGGRVAGLVVGATGVTTSALRPYGSATIAGRTVEVVSEGGMLPAGTPVRVVARRGIEIVVAPAPEAQPDSEPAPPPPGAAEESGGISSGTPPG